MCDTVTKENKLIVRRYYEEVLARGALSLVDELLAAEYVDQTSGGGLPQGRGGLRQLVSALRNSIRDLHCTIQELTAYHDRVVAAVAIEGTVLSRAGHKLPTSESMRGTCLQVWRVSGGKIVESWGHTVWTIESETVPAGSKVPS